MQKTIFYGVMDKKQDDFIESNLNKELNFGEIIYKKDYESFASSNFIYAFIHSPSVEEIEAFVGEEISKKGIIAKPTELFTRSIGIPALISLGYVPGENAAALKKRDVICKCNDEDCQRFADHILEKVN